MSSRRHKGALERLSDLDRFASDFEFPTLDNVHFRLIAGRMRGYLSEAWDCLIIDLFIFRPVEQLFVVESYAYLTRGGDTTWLIAQSGGFDVDDPSLLWATNGDWEPGNNVLELEDTSVRIRLRNASSRAAPSSEPAKYRDEVEWARALLESVGYERLMPIEQANRALGLPTPTTLVFAITDWDHPDIAVGEKPSDSQAIRMACEALALETAPFSYDGSGANLRDTRWSELP